MRRKSNYVFIAEKRRHSLRSFLKTLLAVVLMLGVIGAVFSVTMSGSVRLISERVTIPGLPAEIENWSILHISDLHGRMLGDNQGAIRNALGSVRYSCVVITGDVTDEDGGVDAMLALLKLIPSGTPILLMPGDEDPPAIATSAHGSLSVWNDWAQRLIDAGVTIVDEPVSLKRGKSTLWFVPEYIYTLDLDGMARAYSAQLTQLSGEELVLTPDESARKRAAEYQLEKIDRIRVLRKTLTTDDVVITLNHAPLRADYVMSMRAQETKESGLTLRNSDLVLAGHLCGGQWRIPFVGAVWVPELGFFPNDSLVQGLSRPGGMTQYISPGLGASAEYGWMKGRVFNQPAITMIYLTSSLT